MEGKTRTRRYIIGLYRIRSSIALLASTFAIVFSLGGIVFGLLIYTRNGVPPIELFRFFTIDMNLLGAIGAGMIVLIMFFALALISWNDPVMAFGGNNFFLHVICPLMILLSFLLIESDYRYTVKDNLMCLIPIVIYGGKYIWEVTGDGSHL